MVTEAPRKARDVTEEERQELWERMDRDTSALATAIKAGIASGAEGRTLTKFQKEGIGSVVKQVFSDTVVHEFDADAEYWAQRLAQELASEALLTKLLGIWLMEGAVTDWQDITDGIVGQAADRAADALKPYLRTARTSI